MQICLRGSARDYAIHHRNYTTHPRMATTWRRCCCSSCKRDRLSTKEMLRLPKRKKVVKQRTAKSRAARCAIARDTRRSADGMRPALHTQKCHTPATNQAQ
uniref:Uncharacterized protein n=1 Tax=Bombyx mori TaxID=7091 RepID=A0A8R2M6Z7_BOMMO|nr:uncharacterized protein LOC119630075 [Bombyx mori]